MLRFFRHIRKKILFSDNIRKYVLYALGEIFLVMIGILLALQVNNWNENRKERNLENRYLHRLAADLEKDIESFSRSLNANESRKKRAEFLLEAVDSSGLVSEEPTYFIESIEYAGYAYDPVISDHIFEEIKFFLSVSRIVGQIQLQVIPYEKISFESDFVNPINPSLLDE